jgi:hypothetical protein
LSFFFFLLFFVLLFLTIFIVKRRRTNNTIVKGRRTNNTIVKRRNTNGVTRNYCTILRLWGAPMRRTTFVPERDKHWPWSYLSWREYGAR